MNMESVNIMIVGVGGQGTLLASRVLGNLFMDKGLDVKVSEVHGMSQRGGSVVTYVRAGSDVASPIIAEGSADIIIAFEQLEAVRWAHFIKKGGIIAVNVQKIAPMPVITGAAAYPEDNLEKLKAMDAKFIAVDALSMAVKAGSARSVNMVMLGVVSKFMNYTQNDWEAALGKAIKPSLYSMNKIAFASGRDAAESGE